MFRPVRKVGLVWFVALAVLGAAPSSQQAPLPGGAPQPGTPAPPAKGFILGRVVDAGSGRPVSGAIVTLQGTVTPDVQTLVSVGLLVPMDDFVPGSATPPPQIVTDSDGRFVFRSLGKGSYGLSVRAPAYILGSYGQRRPSGPSRRIALEDDQKFMDATVRVWKYAGITGRVVDELGDAAIGVSLSLARVTTVAGRRRLTPGGSTMTDDRGQYRFGTLAPGTYLVQMRSNVTSMPSSAVEAFTQAMSSPGGMNDLPRELMMMGLSPSGGVRIGDHLLQFGAGGIRGGLLPPQPDADGRMSIYQTVFYPSTTLASQATPLTLASGEERSGIDLQLKLTRAVTVSGTVNGPDGPVGMIAVRLLPGGAEEFTSDSGLEAATSITGPDGGFLFLGVPTGSYSLQAQRVPRPPVSSASSMTTVIQMGGGGMMMTSSGPGTPPPTPTEPTLSARLPVTVADSDVRGLAVNLSKGARVSGRVQFVGSAPPPTAERLAQLAVTMSSSDGAFLSGFTLGRVAADGTFTTMSYPPGRYTLSVTTPATPWSIRSITAGGKDVFGAPLELGANDVTGVVVTFGDVATELSGTASATGSSTGGDAVVLIFPADVQAWIDSGMTPRRARTTGTSTNGEYRISGLPPGDYLVAAFEPTTTIDLQDAQFVSAAARIATRVSLADGEKKSLPLKVSQIR